MSETSLTEEGLSSLIERLQSNDHDVRSAAEREAGVVETQRGFGPALMKLLLLSQPEPGRGQFAALLLKRFIISHWDRESSTFKEPIVSDEDKAIVKQMLPHGLALMDSPTRTAIAMGVAAIAHWEFPDVWPDLLQELLQAMASQNLCLVSGALSCVYMIAEEIEEDHIIQNVPTLMPCLLHILDTAEYGFQIQTKALETFNIVLGICLDASGECREYALGMLPQLLDAWCTRLCYVLSVPLTQDAEDLVKLKIAISNIATRVLESVGQKVPKLAEATLRACCTAFEKSLPIYIQMAIRDNGGRTQDLNCLVTQLFEVLIWFANSRSYRHLLARNVEALVQFSVGYMQITHSQEAEWLADLNAMLNDEDDLSYTVRRSACLFLDELMRAFPQKIQAVVCNGLPQWCAAADRQKAEGEKNCWRVMEATWLLVDCLAEDLRDTGDSEQSLAGTGMLGHVLTELTPSGPPLLVYRCLLVAAKFAHALTPQQVQKILALVVMFLHPDQADILQNASCKALVQLADTVPLAQMKACLPVVYPSVLSLLKDQSEEALQDMLEALKTLIKLDQAQAAQWQPQIAPLMLDIWAANINEPCTIADCQEVFEDLAAIPEILPSLQASVVPVLKKLVVGGQEQPELVEGAICLASLLIKDSQANGIQMIHQNLSQPIMHLICTRDDPAILQSSCEYLRELISFGGELVLKQGEADPSQTVGQILDVLKRLLLPEMGDSAPLYIGQVVNALLRNCQTHSLKHMPQILPAIIQKLSQATSSPLIVSLLLVCCELLLVDTKQMVDFLSQEHNSARNSSLLEALIHVWMERQLEISGKDDIRLSYAALAALLASRHPALMNIQVRGRRLDSDSKVRTRARAKTGQEVWEQVTSPVKIASVLADALLESQEGEALATDSDGSSTADEDDHANNHRHNGLVPELLGIPPTTLKSAMDEGEISNRSSVQEGGRFAGLSTPALIGMQLKTLAQVDPKYLEACCQTLTAGQVQALREACFS